MDAVGWDGMGRRSKEERINNKEQRKNDLDLNGGDGPPVSYQMKGGRKRN
jgi:hypothetical protein